MITINNSLNNSDMTTKTTLLLKVILTFSTAQIFHLQKILRPFDTGSFSRRISPLSSASLTDHN